MGIGGISMAQLAVILIIVMLIFGTKRLRQLGGDLGGMFKGIKDGFREAKTAADEILPEVRELKSDVQSLRRTGQELVEPSYDDERY